jgi:hypothetical protein
MSQVISKGGTVIAFDLSGKGSAAVMLVGEPFSIERSTRRQRNWLLSSLSISRCSTTIDGGASPEFMHNAAQAAAHALPNAQRRTLEGQTHDVAPGVLAPILEQFFKS